MPLYMIQSMAYSPECVEGNSRASVQMRLAPASSFMKEAFSEVRASSTRYTQRRTRAL